MRELSRRDICKGLAFAAGASAVKGGAALAAPIDLNFPADFVWGCASASYQIEGAAAEDGRGRPIGTSSPIRRAGSPMATTGDVACDSYHRMPRTRGC